MSLLKRIRQDLPFVALMAAVLLFNNAIAGVMLVPSGSMEPTLQVGDYIAVNRLAYGFHLPLVSTAEFARWATPKRGDIVIFNAPPAASSFESTGGRCGDMATPDRPCFGHKKKDLNHVS